MPQVLLAALLALSLPLAGSLGGQSWEEQVEIQIESIRDEIASDYEYASELVIGELEDEDADGFTLELDGYAEYVIVGVCDTDCDDLDLAIYDPEEDEAAADFETDDYPVLHVQGEGEYWVDVMMASCEARTCLWAVQVFVRH